MYSGSISLAISAEILKVDDIIDQLSTDSGTDSAFINRRKLVAFKYLCQTNLKLASNSINNDQIRYRIWLLAKECSVLGFEFETKLAKIIWGSYSGTVETELLPYYVEAGGVLPNMSMGYHTQMVLETCVDVDRIPDVIRNFQLLNDTQKRTVVTRMLHRFERMKSEWHQYWIKCMYSMYMDFFRRLIPMPGILSFEHIQLIQSLTDDRFLPPGIDRCQLLLYRCNQRTITRILGLPIDSDLETINTSIAELRRLGVGKYHKTVSKQFRERLGPSINQQTLLFTDFCEYHSEDVLVIQGYTFVGPEFNDLLFRMNNPYTRQPLSETDLTRIRLKIPQPRETMKELCLMYLR